jgi:hypothetical protein
MCFTFFLISASALSQFFSEKGILTSSFASEGPQQLEFLKYLSLITEI